MSPPDAPAPAALGLVWRAAGVVAVPILAASLVLWRSDALQAQEIATLRADVASLSTSLREHLDAEQRRRDAVTARDQEIAVAMARLQAAVDAAGRSIDALLTALSRRR